MVMREKTKNNFIGFDGPTPAYMILWETVERQTKTMCYTSTEVDEQIQLHADKYATYEVIKVIDIQELQRKRKKRRDEERDLLDSIERKKGQYCTYEKQKLHQLFREGDEEHALYVRYQIARRTVPNPDTLISPAQVALLRNQGLPFPFIASYLGVHPQLVRKQKSEAEYKKMYRVREYNKNRKELELLGG
ncbi:hypothetical protein X560_0404 [Listeria fleischmannii 1991]|uniref:Uncharacterized protein n=2 Tax=Listeria fleischmannii TaxID=1069827 RepID=A0A2X3GGR8_9LIST|nr:hypothetical protein [Listeria fleischmannii]EMG27512.1 hypothetical protein LFLEISCH_10754 [Listeria fleischmannii subsp. fleischmannii LU2006-1]KMT60984.1 hypothetical protein X560_0404 [Listeria fleischmannii 1991]SQC67338.1 Uncharacterised protein [Listeria fleischmannii subsp. fleischmannii]